MRRGDRRRAFLFFWPSRPYNRDEPDVRRSEKPELLSYVAVSHVPPLALRTARMEEASCVSVCRSAEAPLSLSPPTVNVTVLLGFVIREATLS